jgi:hypothetical protein
MRPGKFNKPQYAQPSYVHILIEHENGRNPEEEWYKLIHWYAPLKVLICYDRRASLLDEFCAVKVEANQFHLRSDEEYLVIIGELRAEPLKAIGHTETKTIPWRGWLIRTHEDRFREIG